VETRCLPTDDSGCLTRGLFKPCAIPTDLNQPTTIDPFPLRIDGVTARSDDVAIYVDRLSLDGPQRDLRNRLHKYLLKTADPCVLEEDTAFGPGGVDLLGPNPTFFVSPLGEVWRGTDDTGAPGETIYGQVGQYRRIYPGPEVICNVPLRPNPDGGSPLSAPWEWGDEGIQFDATGHLGFSLLLEASVDTRPIGYFALVSYDGTACTTRAVPAPGASTVPPYVCPYWTRSGTAFDDEGHFHVPFVSSTDPRIVVFDGRDGHTVRSYPTSFAYSQLKSCNGGPCFQLPPAKAGDTFSVQFYANDGGALGTLPMPRAFSADPSVHPAPPVLSAAATGPLFVVVTASDGRGALFVAFP
jgi:hypothetical protein